MKALITALALVTLIANPTFAQAARASAQNDFVFKTDQERCQSGQYDFCHWRGYPLWQWDSGAHPPAASDNREHAPAGVSLVLGSVAKGQDNFTILPGATDEFKGSTQKCSPCARPARLRAAPSETRTPGDATFPTANASSPTTARP